MAKILIVEDDPDLQAVLEYNLKQAGHDPSSALTGGEGLRLARGGRPDLVLLDVMLPDIQGTDVCRVLKGDPGTRDVPIVMLTARGEEIDRVVGLELGAEDYVVKPFSVRELLLRIQAVMRRGRAPAKPPRETAVEFGVLKLDEEAHRVWMCGEELELTLVEFKLLVTLFHRRDRVQTRASLLDAVWGVHANVTTRTVDTHVKRLREKLGDARDYIETVRGVGYRFAGTPPEVAVARPPASPTVDFAVAADPA